MKKSKRIKKSNSWKIKQHRDQFFKKSKTLGYRSRSAFKLIELNKKYKFIKKNTNLLDLGSCPGGWSQVAAQIVKTGKIMSIDTQRMEPIKNVKFLIVFGLIKKLVILLILIYPLFSSGQTNPYSDKFAHTYSIVAKDAKTGEMAVGVQSHWFSVGTLVSWGKSGVGVVATQSFVNPSYGPQGIKLMESGISAKDALKQLTDKYSRIIEKNEGEVVKTENWGLLNLSYIIKKNKKGSYIHFKIKGKGNIIDELEKNEAIDKKLLRYLTVRVKKFDLDANYFTKRDDDDKRESYKN